MKAMVRKAFGGPEQLVSKDVPIPMPDKGEVLLRVRALGINRAELYMRSGAWGDVSIISGIEAVGQVEHDPSGKLAKGTTVVTFMGGLGRTRPGSYAQYTTALAPHVLPIETSLGWTDLATIPEAYATAWSCLCDHLRLARGETVVIRGGTSSVALAAINVASELGAVVVATADAAAPSEPARPSRGRHSASRSESSRSRSYRRRTTSWSRMGRTGRSWSR